MLDKEFLAHIFELAFLGITIMRARYLMQQTVESDCEINIKLIYLSIIILTCLIVMAFTVWCWKWKIY